MRTSDWPQADFDVPPMRAFTSEDALESASAPVPGVYLLFDYPGNVVYIGQSADVARRLKDHRSEGTKDFHYALFYHLDDESSRLRLEGILILLHLPAYNKGLNLGLRPGRAWEIRWKRPKAPKKQ